jgi:hypothetical protein
MQIFAELFKHLDAATFGAGVISGIALSIAVYTIGAFIRSHWKTTLLFCAIATTTAIVAVAL